MIFLKLFSLTLRENGKKGRVSLCEWISCVTDRKNQKTEVNFSGLFPKKKSLSGALGRCLGAEKGG
jgi:hypothetical protein